MGTDISHRWCDWNSLGLSFPIGHLNKIPEVIDFLNNLILKDSQSASCRKVRNSDVALSNEHMTYAFVDSLNFSILATEWDS